MRLIYTLAIPGHMPTPLNRLLGSHWGTASKLKAKDREVIGNAVMAYGVRPAECRRRVDLCVVLPKGQRAPDPDALQKSLLDALTACGALKNDSHLWVLMGRTTFARGEELTSYITIQDLY